MILTKLIMEQWDVIVPKGVEDPVLEFRYAVGLDARVYIVDYWSLFAPSSIDGGIWKTPLLVLSSTSAADPVLHSIELHAGIEAT